MRKIPLVQHNHLIQALSTDTAGDTLHVGALPRAAWRHLHFVDAHVANSLLKIRAGDRVSIPKEIPRRLIPGQGLDDLLCRPLCRPLCGGMCSHIEEDDSASLVGQDHKHEQHLKGHRC